MYEQLGQEIGKLVDEKQAAYGGIERVHDAMAIFYPEGIPVDKLKDALLIVRILDKVNRISGGDKAAFGENPFLDIAGYGLLGDDVWSRLPKHHVNKNCFNCYWYISNNCECSGCENYESWKPKPEVTD